MLEQIAGVALPVFVPTVEPTLADITYKPVFALSEDVPTVDVAALMAKEGIKTLSSRCRWKTGGDDRGTRACQCLYRYPPPRCPCSNPGPDRDACPHPVRRDPRLCTLRSSKAGVYIAIDALHVTLAKMTEKDIAVVGDNEPAQLRSSRQGSPPRS